MEFSGIPGLTAGEEGTRLFKMAMNGKWGDVLRKFTENPFFLGAGVTRRNDTLLHLAVSEGQEKTVLKMINIISELPNPEMSVQPRNKQGNTALHLAAMVGNVAMCKCIAEVDPSLIGEPNYKGETPLFTAVLFDKKQAFQFLYDLCPSNDERQSYSRNTRGDTILHSAISEDHFDLALRIIELYGERLVNAVNEDGITALHLLADKPSAFKSGSLLLHGFCNRIIYNCIFIDEHEVEQNVLDDPKEAGKALDQYYPENYKTCIDFFLIFGGFVRSFVLLPVRAMIRRKLVRELRDEERPETQPEDPELSARNGAWKERFSLFMYGLFYKIFKPANRTIMIVLIALGIPMIRKIYEEKKKHMLSIVIMKKLLTSGKDDMYAYYCGAEDPIKQPDKLISTTLDPDQVKDLGDEIDPDDQIGPDHDQIDLDGMLGRDHSNIEDDNVRSKGIPTMIRNIYEGKKKHKLSILIMKKLLTSGKDDMYACYCGPDEIDLDEIIGPDVRKGRKGPETPILIAARNGISEIVEKLLEQFPIAIHDVNEDNKNAMLLAVQNRQPHVFQILLKKNILVRDSMLRVVDESKNNVAHLAAKLGEYRPWLTLGEALHMQYEINWFEFVIKSIPSNFLTHRNKHGKTPVELFIENHRDLAMKGGERLVKTSESYSVVAALIATVAFATSTAVPGGVKEDNGIPTLENRTPFRLFAISSLIALCFSVTALVTFLSIITSSTYYARDFGKDLPTKLLMGLTSLFISIAAMLINFGSGPLFVINDELKYVAYTVYAVACLPVTLFAAMQFPLYFDLIDSTFRKAPRRSYNMASMTTFTK